MKTALDPHAPQKDPLDPPTPIHSAPTWPCRFGRPPHRRRRRSQRFDLLRPVFLPDTRAVGLVGCRNRSPSAFRNSSQNLLCHLHHPNIYLCTQLWRLQVDSHSDVCRVGCKTGFEKRAMGDWSKSRFAACGLLHVASFVVELNIVCSLRSCANCYFSLKRVSHDGHHKLASAQLMQLSSYKMLQALRRTEVRAQPDCKILLDSKSSI